MMFTQADLVTIREKIGPLCGQRPWDVSLGYGSFLTMDFGDMHPGRMPGSSSRGAWHLWVQHVAWRLDEDGEVVAACEDPRPELATGVKRMQGRTVQAIDMRPPALDTTITFEDGIVLRLFPTYTAAYDHWWLFTPDGNVLTIGPGTAWSYHRSTRPWRPASETVDDDRDP